jgi:fatty acid desaturase
VGVLLTAHALVYSAYLLHECAHHTVFQTLPANDRLGTLLSWINGACVARYQDIKRKHLRHHVDRLDVVTFDYRAVLGRCAGWLRRGVLALEWSYVPAVELLMRALVIAAPFCYGTWRERVHVTGVVAIRLAAFAALALLSIKAALLYALAYLLFLHVLRFMDAFQHTYEVYVSRSPAPAPPDSRRNRQYEYENTYSNLLSTRWPWLNLLVLNFPYHNAHHAQTGVPWYRLPALHRTLYGDPGGVPGTPTQVIPCRELLVSYHRHRVTRVLADDYGCVGVNDSRASGFVGAVGVSFLTAI